MSRTIIEHAYVSTMDELGAEHAEGYLVIEGEWITEVGAGPVERRPDDSIVDGTGCLVTPGLVNTHHHLYQWATRGYAQDCTLFEWLTALYPAWGGLDARITHDAAAAGLARLALTGCTTVADHHYVFPADGGDPVDALIAAAREVGPRLHLVRGSMDRGRSQGGLPPDRIVETTEGALAGTEQAIARHHDPARNARIQIAVGPCSPFSVTAELMTGAAELARRTGTRLHTHLAETLDEEDQCRREFGRTPVEYADRLGWLGPDVWLAHGVHLDGPAIARIAATRTGVAHCPTSNARLATGIAPVRDLLAAGARVGLGVDGAASSESGGLAEELHQALLFARQRDGAKALSARQALWLGTVGGARCLGRDGDLGSLEPGKLADLAVWRMDGLNQAGITDPVTALVFGAPAPLELVLVGGKPVVERQHLIGPDEAGLAAALRASAKRLIDNADKVR